MKRTTRLVLAAALATISPALSMRRGTKPEKLKKNDQAVTVFKAPDQATKPQLKQESQPSSPILSPRGQSIPELSRLIQESRSLKEALIAQQKLDALGVNKQEVLLSTLSSQVEHLIAVCADQSKELKTMQAQVAALTVAALARKEQEILLFSMSDDELNEPQEEPKALPAFTEFVPRIKRSWEPSKPQTVGNIWESPAYVPAPKNENSGKPE